MEEVVVETTIRVTPDDTFDFLLDFPGYVRYSDYLERIERRGDGGPGTRYDLEVSWWRLSYTARTEVTAIDRPNRIEWQVLRAVNATGTWEVSEIDPAQTDWVGSRVRLRIRYDAESADASVLDLPRFVSLGWVVRRLRPIVIEEAEATVERIVADLEGEPRPVDLSIRTIRG